MRHFLETNTCGKIKEKAELGLECCSVVEHLPDMQELLGLILSSYPHHEKKEEEKVDEGSRKDDMQCRSPNL